MSTRTKKAPSTPAKTAAASPASTSGRSSRPPSPTVISRVQEKNELASLNDRLAAYIERVRHLESENSRLSRMVQTQEETVTREVSGIKGLYEGELASARNLLDDLAKEKAKLQFDNSKLKSELDEALAKQRAKDKEIETLRNRLFAAESQVSEIQARLNDAVNQRRYFEDEFNKLKKELEASVKNLSLAEKQLEEETIKRVDLENRNQSLREEFNFTSQIHEQQMTETMSRSRIVVDEVDGRLQVDYENKLREAMQDLRDENEQQLRQMREETEGIYARKMAELQEHAERSIGASEKVQSELRNARRICDELSSEISRLTSQNQMYEARIRDLENQLKNEKSEHAVTVDTLKAELRRMRAAMEDQLHEYRDLMDVKIQLDSEIAAYRKPLKSEESRLSISMSGRTPATEPMRKRKRGGTELDVTDYGRGAFTQSQSASSSDFAVRSSAKDVVEVQEIDVGGKFVKLSNSSVDKDVSLGGWILNLTAGDQEVAYKFHRNINLKSQQTITVWSSDAEQTHSPPSTLVMKDQQWPTGDSMKATLNDNKGDEMATQELTRSALRTSSMFIQSGAGDQEQMSTQARKSWGWPSLFSN